MANPSANAGSTNPFGVDVQALDYDAADAPTTKTYHGASIVVNGSIVGRITSFQPNIGDRDGVHVYEVSHRTWGHPVDYVPGRVNGFTISIARVEVWNAELERAVGLSDTQFDTLLDQTRPFQVNEFLFRGTQLYRHWLYRGCWLRSMNSDAVQADGDGIYRVNAELAYVSRTRLQ